MGYTKETPIKATVYLLSMDNPNPYRSHIVGYYGHYLDAIPAVAAWLKETVKPDYFDRHMTRPDDKGRYWFYYTKDSKQITGRGYYVLDERIF